MKKITELSFYIKDYHLLFRGLDFPFKKTLTILKQTRKLRLLRYYKSNIQKKSTITNKLCLLMACQTCHFSAYRRFIFMGPIPPYDEESLHGQGRHNDRLSLGTHSFISVDNENHLCLIDLRSRMKGSYVLYLGYRWG